MATYNHYVSCTVKRGRKGTSQTIELPEEQAAVLKAQADAQVLMVERSAAWTTGNQQQA
jgi:hypothetical protein